jgi:hypothetical protein
MKTLKSLLIFVLAVGLAAAAVFTRPNEASFHDYLTGARPRTGTSVDIPRPFATPLSESDAERYADRSTFADRILWVDVRGPDGRVLYTGAFAHWFPHAAAREAGPGR